MESRIAIFDRIEKPVRFYFTRHGESTGNQQKRIQGHSDTELTDKGRLQADTTGAWLADKGIGRIFTSPLVRARETAERMAAKIGVSDIVVVDDLRELDTGKFSGHSFDELAAKYPEEWKAFRWKSWEAVEGAEKIATLVARALAHWNRVITAARNDAAPSLTVTHGGFLQWLIRSSFSDEWTAWMPLIHTSNCGISEFYAEPVNEAPAGASGRIYSEWMKINFTDFAH